ncbi:putative D,D-dipeptide transport ATP-binding protein DdpD [compost metagenome]
MKSIPHLGEAGDMEERLASIPGTVPSLAQMPKGCRFHDRCEFAEDRCKLPPPLMEVSDGHYSRCWLAEKSKESTNRTLTEGII